MQGMILMRFFILTGVNNPMPSTSVSDSRGEREEDGNWQLLTFYVRKERHTIPTVEGKDIVAFSDFVGGRRNAECCIDSLKKPQTRSYTEPRSS